jgi:hypothetical protein
MNVARVAVAGATAWVVSLAVAFLVNEVLLKNVYLANAAVLRPEAEIAAKLPLGFAVMLVGFLAFAYAYAKGYEGTNGVIEGIRYGALVAVMINCFAAYWYYATVPIDRTMAAAMAVDYLVEWTLYGAIVGAIYRPMARRAGPVAHR